MTVVFGLVSSIFVFCAVAIAGSGIEVLTDGDAVGGAVGIAIGVLVLYPAYLFARTSWRARRSVAADPAVSRRNAREWRFSRAFVLVAAAFAVASPVPGLVKVVAVATAVMGGVAALAFRVDAPRRD
jgi:hypothetical protein